MALYSLYTSFLFVLITYRKNLDNLTAVKARLSLIVRHFGCWIQTHYFSTHDFLNFSVYKIFWKKSGFCKSRHFFVESMLQTLWVASGSDLNPPIWPLFYRVSLLLTSIMFFVKRKSDFPDVWSSPLRIFTLNKINFEMKHCQNNGKLSIKVINKSDCFHLLSTNPAWLGNYKYPRKVIYEKFKDTFCRLFFNIVIKTNYKLIF